MLHEKHLRFTSIEIPQNWRWHWKASEHTSGKTRKVMKRAGGGASSSPSESRRKKLGGKAASSTAAAGQKTGGVHGRGRGYERKEASPDTAEREREVGSIVLGEDVGDGDSEPEEGELRFFDEENAYVATAPTSRCGCM